MVNQIIKPIIKPFPLLIKSQFAIEILSHNKGPSMITWPLMDLVYLLLQEELNEAQGVTVQTIIENNPMIYNAIHQVNEHYENTKITNYSRPINVIHQQLLLIHTLLKTSQINPVINHQEIQKLMDLNRVSYQSDMLSSTMWHDEIKNEYAVRYTRKYLYEHSGDQNIKLLTQYNEKAYPIIMRQERTSLNTYAKLYARNESRPSTEMHSKQNDYYETSTKVSEHHFLSKLVNRILGRNQKSIALESEKTIDNYNYTSNNTNTNINSNTNTNVNCDNTSDLIGNMNSNKNTEAVASFSQWSAVQLLTAMEVSTPLAHYINQSSNRFIYRSYADHKLNLFYDEVKKNIHGINSYSENKIRRVDNVLITRNTIKQDNPLIQNMTFSKKQLNAHEYRLNAMLQYVVAHKYTFTNETQNQEINQELNQKLNQELNQELNLNVSRNLIQRLDNTQKKNSCFMESIVQTVKTNNNLSDINGNTINISRNIVDTNSNIANLNKFTYMSNSIDANNATNVTNMNNHVNTNINSNDERINIFFENNHALIATHLIRTNMSLILNNTSNLYRKNQNQINDLSEENTLYRSLNLINRQITQIEQNVPYIASSDSNLDLNHDISTTVNLNSAYKHMVNKALFNSNFISNIKLLNEFGSLYKINSKNNSKSNTINSYKASSDSNLDLNHDISTTVNLNSAYITMTAHPSNGFDILYETDRPLMVYHMNYKNLHNDYQSALKHILLTNMASLYRLDNMTHVPMESIMELPIKKLISKPLNNLIGVKAINATYLKNITEKYNALKTMNTFTQDMLNHFFSAGDAKFLKQISHSLEQINTQSLGLYQSVIINDLIHNTAFSGDQFLTHRFNSLSSMIKEGHFDSKTLRFELSDRHQSVHYSNDPVTVLIKHALNEPQSLIRLAASLVNQSNRFLEHNHYLQTTTRKKEPLSTRWIKSILNHKSDYALNQNFSDQSFWNQSALDQMSLDQISLDQSSFNPIFFSQKSFDNSFKHTFEMLYRLEHLSIQKNALLSKVDHFINQSILKKAFFDPSSETNLYSNLNSNSKLEFKLNTQIESLFNSKLETPLTSEFKLKSKSETETEWGTQVEAKFNQILKSHHLKNITENKTFLVNLEHRQLQFSFKNKSVNQTAKANLNINQYIDLYSSRDERIEKGVGHHIKAFRKTYPIRTFLIKAHKRVTNNLNEEVILLSSKINPQKVTIKSLLSTSSHRFKNHFSNLNKLSQMTLDAPFFLTENINSSNEIHPLSKIDNNISNMNNRSNINNISNMNNMNNINNISSTNNRRNINNISSTNNRRNINNISSMNNINHIMKVNPKMITLKMNTHTLNQSNSLNQNQNQNQYHGQTNHFATKWQNTVILKNDDESIKLTFNASYMRQMVVPTHKINLSSVESIDAVDYTKEISRLMAELTDTEKLSQKVKGRKQKKAAKKNDAKLKWIEKEIEHLKFQSEQQHDAERIQFKETYIYQGIKASQKKLDGETIIQSQLHYKNQFLKPKKSTPINLSEKTVKTISYYTNTIQKNMKQMRTMQDIKTPSVTHSMIQMSTFLLQKQTPIALEHHTEKLMSYSDVESSQLSHKTVEREIIREIMASPEMASVLPREREEAPDPVEKAVAASSEIINIDKISDQVYKRVTERVERERRRRGL
ncbi:hypothetical protein [Fusibacter sp. 3D3]|uniref:hypothetical protein n=1 Tax=Fusibacter sp. 3D3 TaxID=1048380 RepID=UPI000852FDFB|nr:hypothetical protein [Fusibacter sp. 3D3]GAU77507.1 putative hemolysin [Fusibacter sp. 3D3]